MTFAASGVHGSCVLTAVTAQTLDQVTRVDPVEVGLITAQIDGILEAFPVAAVKTGLLPDAAVVELVVDRVADGRLPAPVVDPVMVNGRGERFASDEILAAYREHLIPLARVITPNRAEAELLVGRRLPTAEAVVESADAIRALGAGLVIVTGGAFDDGPVDVLVDAGDVTLVRRRVIATSNLRGSGCTFAAALTAGLAAGLDVGSAVSRAGETAHCAIATAAEWSLGPDGPVSHLGDRSAGSP